MLILTKCMFTVCVAVLAGLIAVGCSDTTNITQPPPPGARMDSVSVSPASASLNGLGAQQQFAAQAFDANGGEISATFDWASTNGQVVVVGSGGLAVASGPGNAFIIVSAGGASDSARVTVTVGGSTIRTWASGVDGNWEDPTRWVGGEAPKLGDIVVIDAAGNYTVTLTGDVAVTTLVLGDPNVGTPVLATGSNTLTIEDGSINGFAELKIDGLAKITGEVNWRGGDIRGSGTVEIEPGAELAITGDGTRQELEATVRNRGILAVVANAAVDLRGGNIDNTYGALIDFRGDGSIVTFSNSSITNTGSILKSEGTGEARIDGGQGMFSTTGRVDVDSGTLALRGGTWRGVFEIEAGAQLDQTGSTTIVSIDSRGEGAIRFAGNVTLAERQGVLLTIRHLIIDMGVINQISGPGDLQCASSLLWRQGTIVGEGVLNLPDGATMRFEGAGSKRIEQRLFDCRGTVEGRGSDELILENGAQLHILNTGRWVQNGAGAIRSGLGAVSSVLIDGEFEKQGPGAFTVEPALTCSGTLLLEGEELVVAGVFQLTHTGTITGGGTEDVSLNRKLILIDAPSAVMAGTIDLGVGDELRRMAILGAVTLESTFRVEVDVRPGEAITHETLTFLTGGIELAGTLAVTIGSFPDPPVQYRVVSMTAGTGQFDTVTGAGFFTNIQQDDRGVLLIRD